jgi:RNA polymerase sigma-70 factor (ECF subfamily)
MPERALALNLYLEGTSMDEIAMQIGRSAAATKEYLSQCRKKIKPYIAHCTEQLTDE